jgi:hypothetical protein
LARRTLRRREKNAAAQEAVGGAENRAVPCLSWRQTAGCTPFGAHEAAHDRSCDTLVPAGISGYCECGGAYKGPGLTCDHPPLRCRDACDPAKRDAMVAALSADDGGDMEPVGADGGAQRTTKFFEARLTAAALADAAVGADARHYFAAAVDAADVAASPMEQQAVDEERRADVRQVQRNVAWAAAAVPGADADFLKTVEPFVAGGGPAILGPHAAFDAHVKAMIDATPHGLDDNRRPQRRHVAEADDVLAEQSPGRAPELDLPVKRNVD